MAIVEDQMVEVNWNNYTKKHYLSKGYEFTKVGDTFIVHIKDLLPGGSSLVLAICDWCGENFTRPIGRLNRKGNKHHYCTNKCQLEHSVKVRNDKRLTNNCELCNKEYYIINFTKNTSRFCSAKCLSKWQSEAFKGKNSSKYVDRIKVPCSWCKNTIERTPNKLETRKDHFCNEKCRQSWHREIFMKSDESMERNRKTMLSNLANGNIKMTKTRPHVIVNEILNKTGIEHVDEKIIYQYSLDIYLNEYDLYIEINGGYWHCDSRIHKRIEFDHQLNRIIGDKRKRSYLKNNLSKNILYLWEKDIIENPELCRRLIDLFIKNDGELENYHSFNYNLTEKSIALSNIIITPYMELPYDQLTNLVDTATRENVTSYDSSKHITYNCEHCGNEKEQLLSIYKNAKNHFCSVECKNLAQQGDSNLNTLGHIIKCPCCQNDFRVPNNRYKKWTENEIKNLFCSKECKYKWETGKKNPNIDKRTEVCCLFCKKTETVTISRSKRYRFCSKECLYNSRKNVIEYKCEMCGKDCQCTPSKYEKSKNHFCSNKCADTYRQLTRTVYNKCYVCNKWFRVQKSKHYQINCSHKCQSKWQSIVLVGKNANNFKCGKFSHPKDSIC